MDDLKVAGDAVSDSKASAAEDETLVDHDRSVSVHRRQLQRIATDGARFRHFVPDGPKKIDGMKKTKRILQCYQDEAPSSRKAYAVLALVTIVVCGVGYLFLDYPLFYRQQSGPTETSSLEQASGKLLKHKSAAQRTGERPNLLFILTDQQRFDAIGRVQSELNIPKQCRIHTPNLDRLSREGAYFRNSYTHCPVCVPARTSLLTGRTLENTGVRSNFGKNENEIHAAGVDAGFKIPKLRTYDEILVQDHGYVAEYHGKWHTTESKGYVYSNEVTANNGRFAWFGKYENDNATKHLAMCLHPDYAAWLKRNKIDQCRDKKGILLMGKACVPDGFSLTARQGEAALQALRRLGRAGNPFSLHLSIKAPHSPFIPTARYYDMYDPDDMPIPPSLNDEMENSGYATRQQLGKANTLRNLANVQRLWATYYGFVTEIDEMVGSILTTIDELGISNNTMVVFAADHGEMLGSHGLMGKYVLYEESARVPLMMKFPGTINPGVVVDDPVSLIDLHSTLLDYLQVSGEYESDGRSLRRHVEKRDDMEEDSYTVAEWSKGKEVDMKSPGYKERRDIYEPGFMIRKGDWKLLMPQYKEGGLDMLYNLTDDPYETENLLGVNGPTASDEVIGKAEHLKALLLQYLARTGHPDLDIMARRRTWRPLPFWIGDVILRFRPLLRDGTRTEWLHFGSTTKSVVPLENVVVEGPGAKRYKIEWIPSTTEGHRVLAITYSSEDPNGDCNHSLTLKPATLMVQRTLGGKSTIRLVSPECRSST